jgi:uncharacterized protein YjiS (DUF1127 family)
MRDFALNEAIFRGEIGSPRVATLWRNWKARRAVARLEDLDEHLLADIGVTRAEVLWAKNLPLTVNAALALEERSHRFRTNRERFYR